MKRLVAAMVAAVTIFGNVPVVRADGEFVTYDEPLRYNLFDLSPYLPQKAGHLYDGMWTDGADWLVTNGSLLLTVNGKTGAVANLSRQLDEQRIYGIYNAAGVNGTWLIVASADGDVVGSSWLYGKKSSVRYLVLNNGALNPITLNIDLSAEQLARVPLAFSANGRIYILTQSFSEDRPSKLYEYRDGGVTPVAIPDWAQPRLGPYNNALFQDGNALGVFRWTYDSGDLQELRFEGTWKLINLPEVVDEATQMRYAESRGLLYRDAYVPDAAGNLALSYGLNAPRDAFLSASRREDDGATLLSGYGTNGARLILAKPVITLPGYDNWVGALTLAVARVPGTASRYILTSKATGPVTTIRILKDGIGIARCDAQICRTEVDVKGTADRFEAWGVSAYPVVPPLTSKSVLLRDTGRIADTPAWTSSIDTKQTGWSWLRPADFTRPETDRATWNLGAYLEHPISFLTAPGNRREAPGTLSSSGIRTAVVQAGSLAIETYIEGRLATTCRPPVQTLTSLRTALAKGSYVNFSAIRIEACPASVGKTDATAQNTALPYSGYPYLQHEGPKDVRVYGKITWADEKGTHVIVSPTDVVRFE